MRFFFTIKKGGWASKQISQRLLKNKTKLRFYFVDWKRMSF